jgi:fatty acid/phospholipid biosynthesis enzyme
VLIALDAMGGDNAPAEIIAGALLARVELDVDIALVGAREVIAAELVRQGESASTFEIIHASEAATGVLVASMSCPYRHMPPSRRSESRAPRPIGFTR